MSWLAGMCGQGFVPSALVRSIIVFVAAVAVSAAVAPDRLVARTTAAGLHDASAHRWPDWTAYGGSRAAELGDALASIGDVNGDGFGDLLVGSPGYSGTFKSQGRALVFHGSAGGLDIAPSWTAEGGSVEAGFGAAVASAGDINGDGISDVVVGEPTFARDGSRIGRVHVYVSTPTGLSPTAFWTVEGTQDGAYFGDSVAGVLDVNGDTFNDILVGAPRQDDGQATTAGCAYLFFGTSGGLEVTPRWETCGAYLDDYLGESLAAAGDVNGDHIQDFIIGAPSAFSDHGREGAAYVFHGQSPLPPTTPAWSAESDQDGAEFGYAVASAGDINGDTYGDVIVSAPWYEATYEGEGRTYVYAGSDQGLSAAPAWQVDGGMAYADFGNALSHIPGDGGTSDIVVSVPGYSGDKMADGKVVVYAGSVTGLADTPRWVAAGLQTGAWFGDAVGSGDFDGDGAADLVVGASDYTADHEWEGATHMYRAGVLPRAPFVVNSADDDADAHDSIRGDGDCMDALHRCTLRAAIQETNALLGPDQITFASAMTITVSADVGAMPTIIDQLTLDGSSVWDDAGDRPGVVLDGAGGTMDGLRLHGDGSAVFGLGVTGCYGTGIVIAAANCTVGGPGHGRRNVISGNVNEGVTLWGDEAHHNVVQSNYIGVAPDGITKNANNGGVWITLGAKKNVIGGDQTSRRNVISGNNDDGVAIEGVGTDLNAVAANYIGLAADGSTVLGNIRGIDLSGEATGNAIGWAMGADSEALLSGALSSLYGPSPAPVAVLSTQRHSDRIGSSWSAGTGQPTGTKRSVAAQTSTDGANHVVGNQWEGIRVAGEGKDNQVSGNIVRDNGVLGVVVDGQSNCSILHNTIERNHGPGVLVTGATAKAVRITSNSIRNNDGKGIVLAGGANGGITPPSIIDASATGASGIACANCEVEIFSDEADEGGLPETYVYADADGNWAVSTALRGPRITAIQSSYEAGSSEFSAPWTIDAPPAPSATASPTASPTATVTSSVVATNTATATSTPTPTTDPATNTPTPTPSAMPTAESSPSSSPTPTPFDGTPEPSASPAATDAASATPSAVTTAVATITPTPTESPMVEIYIPIVLNRYAVSSGILGANHAR